LAVALYPATAESEKISFNQLNRQTGRRIKYLKVDADTGEEVSNEDIVKGYKVDTDTFIEVTKEELENVALESTRTIEIDEFVDRSEIDPRYLIRPYYLRPDGKVGHDAFAVIRDMNKVAIGRVVLRLAAMALHLKEAVGAIEALGDRLRGLGRPTKAFRADRLRMGLCAVSFHGRHDATTPYRLPGFSAHKVSLKRVKGGLKRISGNRLNPTTLKDLDHRQSRRTFRKETIHENSTDVLRSHQRRRTAFHRIQSAGRPVASIGSGTPRLATKPFGVFAAGH
jgi:hypothetical protein